MNSQNNYATLSSERSRSVEANHQQYESEGEEIDSPIALSHKISLIDKNI
jgi:hypothetical protein